MVASDLFIVTIFWVFSEYHIVGNIQHVACSDWLLSLCDIHLIFLHISVVHFFLWITNIPLSGYIIVYLSIPYRRTSQLLPNFQNYE